MTHLDDRHLLERFGRRMADIEAEIPAPPRWRGPARRTDGPRLSFGSLFSATGFVLAGAIVALFGGFLLAGLLTQPKDGSVPAPGVSASATAEAIDPTTTAPPPSTRSDLIPGVDLTIEEIAPDVFRVLGDGAGHDLDRIGRVVQTGDGGFWVHATEPGAGQTPRIFRLGEPGVFTPADGLPESIGRMEAGADGRLYVMASASSIASAFDDGTDDLDRWMVLVDQGWIRATADEVATAVTEPGWRAGLSLTADDGTTWEIDRDANGTGKHVRHSEQEETRAYALRDMNLQWSEGLKATGSDAIDPKALAIAEDGTVWSVWAARYRDGGRPGEGAGGPGLALAEFDGASWKDITPVRWRIGTGEARNEGGRPGEITNAGLSVAPDGTLHVAADIHENGFPSVDATGGYFPVRRVEASWDGDRWNIESRGTWDLASIAELPGESAVDWNAVIAPDGTMVLQTSGNGRDSRLYVVQPEFEPLADEEALTVASATTLASPPSETSYVVAQVAGTGLWGRSLRSLATDEAIWVPGDKGVSRLDGVTNETTTIGVSEETRWLVASDDAVWAVAAFEVERIDRRDLSYDGPPITRARGEPFMWQDDCHPPVIADGSLWIASPGSESHSLVEIDLASQTIRDEYVADADWSSDGCGPWMGAVGDAIWVHSQDPDGTGQRLTRFDLGTREFSDTLDDLPGPQNWWGCCVVDDDAIWLMNKRSVSRFDLASLEVTDTLDVGRDLNGGIVAGGAIWVVDRAGGSSDDNMGVVHRIDTSTREVTDVIDVGQNPEPPTFLHGAVWVANHSRPWSVTRIDVESRQVTDTVPIPVEHPHTPLASDGVMWVYTQEGKLLRIDPGMASE